MLKIKRGQCILCERENIPVIQINCCQRCLTEAFRNYWETKGGQHD